LFAWKHFDNPFGSSLMLVAEEGGQIAGFRAFMRWVLTAPGGQALRCVRAVDTATHPEFQRRGVFKTLTLTGIELAAAEGVDLIFNTPNKKSGAGYLSMGWQLVGRVGVMFRPGWGLLRGRGNHVEEFWAKLDKERLAGLPPDRAPRGLRTPRTPQYMSWRFASHPTGRYLLAGDANGYAIGRIHRRKGRRELWISELCRPGSSQALARLRAESSPDYTVGWFSSGAIERRWAMSGGLIPLPGVKTLTLMARPVRELSVDIGWQNWDLSLGDLELL
jgi:hypothetical protein